MSKWREICSLFMTFSSIIFFWKSVLYKISVVMMITSASGLNLISPVRIPKDKSGNLCCKSLNFSLLKALIGVV